MITYEAYNPQNPEHGKLIFSLLLEVGKELCSDNQRDFLLTLRGLDRDQDTPRTFLVFVDNEFAGYVGAVRDGDIAFLEGASLKKFQRFFFARESTAWFCRYAFEHLGIRKIKSICPIFKRRRRRLKWGPAELVCRSIGFTKEGLSREELVFNGKPVDAVSLALFPQSLRMFK